MPLAERRQPFDHPDWLFEVKYDGFRLVSRKGNTYKSFPALCQSLGVCLGVSDAVLDGEIVYLDPDGKPQFSDLMRRRGPQYFYGFDLLWLNFWEGRIPCLSSAGPPLLQRSRTT
jgi:bifunctional non-homologous end joining protein LigD